jgi:hypothetical protein
MRPRRHKWEARLAIPLTTDEALSIAFGVIPYGVKRPELPDAAFDAISCGDCGIDLRDTARGCDYPDCPGPEV